MIRFAIPLAVALAACPAAQPGGIDGDDAPARSGRSQPRMEFTASQLPLEQQVPEPTATARGGSGTITVTGRLSAPDPCRRVTGELERTDSGLELRVVVAPSGAEICAQVISAFEYRGVVTGMAPGEHAVRVVHTYPQTGWETETVLSERVRVQ